MAWNSLDRLSKRIASLPTARELLIESIRGTAIEPQIIDANQRQMFDGGIDSKGESLGEYAPFTKFLKAQKGQRFDHITLKDTGDFYDSMHIKYEFEVTVEADMKKPDKDLAVIYPDALGLTRENKDELLPEIKQRFVETIKKKL